MIFKEISPKLRLSLEEYAETWSSLITVYYSRGLESEIVDKELELNEEDMIMYSMNLAAVLLIIAVRIWNSKILISESIRKKTCEAIVDKFYSDLHEGCELEFKNESIKFFQSKYQIFDEICSSIINKDKQKRQSEIIGLARYLVAQVSSKSEKLNVRAIEKLSLLFMDAANTCLKLAGNSSVENLMFGKLKFIVQK